MKATTRWTFLQYRKKVKDGFVNRNSRLAAAFHGRDWSPNFSHEKGFSFFRSEGISPGDFRLPPLPPFALVSRPSFLIPIFFCRLERYCSTFSIFSSVSDPRRAFFSRRRCRISASTAKFRSVLLRSHSERLLLEDVWAGCWGFCSRFRFSTRILELGF